MSETLMDKAVHNYNVAIMILQFYGRGRVLSELCGIPFTTVT